MTGNLQKEKFELHYYFEQNDNTHSMDAFVRNKCEQELLQIIKIISSELKVNIKVEAEVYKAGGWKEYLSIFSPIVSPFILYFLNRRPTKKSKGEEENLQLSNEYLKLKNEKIGLKNEKIGLKNEKLRRDLDKSLVSNNIDNQTLTSLVGNTKISEHVSGFYNELEQYPKVEKISVAMFDEDEKLLGEYIIERGDFHKFILDNTKLESIVDESAIIEIISLGLKEGSYHWRGIYNETPISFRMLDEEFKNKIHNGQILLKDGFSIQCRLKIKRKRNDFGDVINYGYSVLGVVYFYDEKNPTAISKSKKNKEQVLSLPLKFL